MPLAVSSILPLCLMAPLSLISWRPTLRNRERGTWAYSVFRELRPGTRNGDDRERRPKIVPKWYGMSIRCCQNMKTVQRRFKCQEESDCYQEDVEAEGEPKGKNDEVNPLYGEVNFSGGAPKGKNDGGSKQWECKHCKKRFKSSYTPSFRNNIPGTSFPSHLERVPSLIGTYGIGIPFRTLISQNDVPRSTFPYHVTNVPGTWLLRADAGR